MESKRACPCDDSEASFTHANKRYWLEYDAVFRRIAEDPTVRIIVLSSALEKAFSAGVDRAYTASTLPSAAFLL